MTRQAGFAETLLVVCIMSSAGGSFCFAFAGDTDSSSDFEMVPTMRGLRFRDQPSPSGSEFNTPRASMVARASSITDDEGQFVTPRADAAGAFGSMNPVQLQGPSFQVCCTYSYRMHSIPY